ncbi:Ig-like domain-containing protein [Pontibacter aquaedesilientis]|nr:Ig-like domain-containing protein [Pontibacter aquaedesilientis]
MQARPSLVGAVTVEWNAVSGATQYIVEHSLLPDKNFTQLATVPVTAGKTIYSYRATGLGYAETYYYRVKAKSSSGDSPYSTTVSATTHTQSKVFSIMPLGDSNTHGTKSGDSRPDSERIAYRKQLYDLLTGIKAKFSFVGSEKSGGAFLANDQNAGFPAARTMDILSLLKTSSYRNQSNELVSRGSGTYLDKFNPDVVLLHLGTNGGLYGVTDDAQAIAEMEGILDEVDAYEERANKEVTVILGLIINRIPQNAGDDSPGYTSRFNDKVKAMAENRIKSKSDRVVVVDMENAAGIIYKFASNGGDMDDYLHPAVSGYQKMANTWFNALKPLLEPIAADTKAPETTITSKPAAISNSKSATFEFASNEAKVYFEMSLNGAPYATTSTPVTLSNLADGTYTVSVRALDAAGNKDATPATYTWTIITTPPTAPVFSAVTEDRGPEDDDQITSDNTIRLLGKAQAGMDVTVSEASKGILGTTKANSTGDWVYNYEGTALASGTYRFTATAKDIAGNVSEVSKTFTVTIDLTKPDVALTTQAKTPVRDAFQVQLMFTEEVYGLAAADLSVTNASLSNFTAVDKSTYTLTLTPPNGVQGTASILLAAGKVTDLAGNANTASTKLEIAYDLKRPKVAISSEAPQLVKAPFTVQFDFDEDVSGFSAADITLTNANVSNFSTVSGSVYTVRINPTADGEVSVSLAADKALDAAGNGNEASAVLKRIYDVQPPTATLSTSSGNLGNSAFTVTVEFSEPITGLAVPSFTVSNGRATDLKKTGNTSYTVLISPDKDGEVTVLLKADQVQDLAENGNLASNVLKRDFDATPPTVTLSTEAPDLTNAPFNVNFRFSEDVEGFELADVSLTNATAGNFKQISKAEYTALITPAKDGEVTVKVAAGKAQDAATNPNTASNTINLTYDATAPTGYAVRFDTEQVDFINQKDIAVSVTDAEVGATYFYSISSDKGGNKVTGTATAKAVSFKLSGIDVSGLNDGMLTVTFYQVDAAGNQGDEVKAKVEKITKNIMAVRTPEQISVPFKTPYENLPLPKQVEVTYTNGEKENIAVNWQQGNYKGAVAGSYTLTGTLVLQPNTTNQDNRKATITVVVEPNRAPTALQLSTTSFKPDAKPDETIGMFSTTDPDDDTHTYTLANGQGDQHNSLFLIEGDKLYLKSNKGLSGIRSFNIRVRSTDPYQNSIEQTFVLTKKPYQPETKIKLVNAFSPDNDGINDTWVVPELKFYDEISIQVFDRAGVRLFHTTNPEEGWDGRGQNGEVKPGNYFYIIEVKDINLVQKGVLTVLK